MNVTVSSFSFVNPSGGTGRSDWQHNERFVGPATMEVTSGFWDNETGYRFRGLSADPAVTAYLDRAGSKTDRRVYFSEFDIPSPTERAAAIRMVDDADEQA